MTRETRIGLLVGLVFIVMFGLVLAEFTGKSGIQPNQTLAENNNKPLYQRQTLPVPKYEDFPPAIAPAPSPTPSASAPLPPATNMTFHAPPPSADNGAKSVVIASLSPLAPESNDPPPGHSPDPVMGESPEPGPVAVAPPAPSGRVYVVEDKDTFIKIARRFYGSDHENEYKKIMDANKATVKDASGLKKGMKLVIPGVAGVPGPAAGTPTAAIGGRPPVDPPPMTISVPLHDPALALAGTPATAPAASSGRTYVVQTGDTVSKIARKFLSSDSKANVDKILKINKLESPEKLRAGATLESPAK